MIIVRELSNDEISSIALRNGFKTKLQPDGSMSLNPYVFEFVKALFEAARVQQSHQRDNHVYQD